jgi:hypothetical protein
MPDLNDRLRRDGARWREEVDLRHAPDLDPRFDLDSLFDQVTSVPVVVTPVHALRARLAGRAPLLLSVAAVSVAALAVAVGAVLAPDSSDTHPTPPALAATTSPAVSISSSAPATSAARSSSVTPHRTHRSTAAHPAGPGAPAPATSSAATRHKKKKHTHPAGESTSSATGPVACDSANLGISISAPASAGDHATLTVSVVNNGTLSCTITGFPAVQFSGDSTVSATPAADTPTQLTLANGAAATAEVDWDGTSAAGTCTTYATALVSAPGGGATPFPLDPPAQVCDASTFVTHPLAAS